jgi:hypothetical protein
LLGCAAWAVKGRPTGAQVGAQHWQCQQQLLQQKSSRQKGRREREKERRGRGEQREREGSTRVLYPRPWCIGFNSLGA